MAGRPVKENRRDKQYRLRLNEEENEMLSFCSEKTGKPKSDIVRRALKVYYENIKNIADEEQDARNKDGRKKQRGKTGKSR